jgi:hypothetical protein
MASRSILNAKEHIPWDISEDMREYTSPIQITEGKVFTPIHELFKIF